MDIIDARPDLVGVIEFLEDFQQFHIRARCFYGNHIRVQRRDGIHDVIELAIAHMGMDLGIVPRHRGIELKRLHRPIEIFPPFGLAQRQTFPQRRLIDLNDADARLFQIRHFVAQRQGDLPGDGFAADVLAGERPA